MARGNKFKPEGRTPVLAVQAPAAESAKQLSREASEAVQPKPAAGKRKRADAVPQADGSTQRVAINGQASASASASTPAAHPGVPNGHGVAAPVPGRRKQALKKGSKGQQGPEPGLPETQAPAVTENGPKSGKAARPRSKKKRQASSYAKLGKPPAPLHKAASAVVVLESIHFSTVVAPPLRGPLLHAQ